MEGMSLVDSCNDVTVTPNDDIVIADCDNSCVIVLDNKLNLLNVIGQGSGS